MADPLYLIQLCPHALRPSLGDRVDIRIVEPDPGQAFTLEVHFDTGVALACERVTLDAGGTVRPFPPLPVAGTVAEVRTAPDASPGVEAIHAYTASSLLPESVLIGVRADEATGA